MMSTSLKLDFEAEVVQKTPSRTPAQNKLSLITDSGEQSADTDTNISNSKANMDDRGADCLLCT